MARLTEDALGARIIDPAGWWPFWRAYLSNIDRVTEDLRAALDKTPKRVKLCEWWFAPNGYVIVRDRERQLSLYETAERTEYRQHIAAWADFARGTWLSSAPTRSGVYPVRDRQGARGMDREIREYGDVLIDVSGGFVPPGRVTSYVGEFWSVPYPRLPGAV